jgi:hypothetical protein
MAKVQNFSENLERSFTRLGHEISARQMSPEMPARPEKEVVKESLRALAVAPQNEPHQASPAGEAASPIPAVLPAYLTETSAPEEVTQAVEQLIQLVFKTDIETAVAAAKRYPPFVEDAFHDALVDKLLPELKKRGYLK